MRWSILSLIITACLAGSGCRQSDPGTPAPISNPSANLELCLRATAGTATLRMGDTLTTAGNEKFTLSQYTYYLTNIVLLGNSLTPDYVQPESYYLPDFAKTDTAHYLLKQVPPGTYTGIRFLIGVDSLHNVSGAQKGALDPDNGMFWTWVSGYVHFRAEGKTITPPGDFLYHIGGFSGAEAVQRQATIPFPAGGLVLNPNQRKKLVLDSDVLEVFTHPNGWEINAIRTVSSPGGNATVLADNYADMLRFNAITD